ncbi:MAG TPA: hypothetical protein VFA86_13230 [Gammaproteobacteria bacterium]|nr:hypothetical protein [Gammaproteobacteria bacterium]
MSVKIREDCQGYPKVAIVPYRYLRELERDAEDYRRLLARLDVALDREARNAAGSGPPRRGKRAPGARWSGLWQRLLGHRREENPAAVPRDGETGPASLPGNVHRLAVARRPWRGSV